LPSTEADGAVLAVQARRDRLDAAIVELAMTPPWALLVGRLGCLRGIGVLTGFGLAVEIGDWQRFTGATIGADLGLVPTEQSSGTQRVQGSITKTGNRATVASISAGPAWTPAASAPPSAWSRSPANWLDGAGAWPSWRPDPSIQAGRWGGTHQRVERPATQL
jgi:hypothetical protein